MKCSTCGAAVSDPAATRCPSCRAELVGEADLDSILGRIDSPDATIRAADLKALGLQIPRRGSVKPDPAKPEPRHGVRARRKSVLIIDDDAKSRAAAVAVLSGAQVPVREAADGRSGLSLLGTLSPDVVVVEPAMAGSISGSEVLERIRSRAEFAALPTILYTREVDANGRYPQQAFIAKADGPEALLDRVIGAFRGPRRDA